MGCGVIIPILETQIAKKRGNEIGTSTGPGPNYSSPNGGKVCRDPCCNRNPTIGTRTTMNVGKSACALLSF